ncbi:SRPBCC domain-containing protein [Streptomyces sp. NPDC047130]|uniref:SRPBCC domain-containing protein n=1 Tax=Streptomyces sp. NPDC047130 TaxID=3155261 RepID=UPI0033C98E45
MFVPVPADHLAAALADPGRVALALPELQRDAAAEGVAGRLKLRVGGSSVTYRGSLGITRQDDGTFTAEAAGGEARGDGTVRATVRVTLHPRPDGTVLHFAATGSAGGRITGFEPDAVRSALTRLMERFAADLPGQSGEDADDSRGGVSAAVTADGHDEVLPGAGEPLVPEFAPAADGDFDARPDAEDPTPAGPDRDGAPSREDAADAGGGPADGAGAGTDGNVDEQGETVEHQDGREPDGADTGAAPANADAADGNAADGNAAAGEDAAARRGAAAGEHAGPESGPGTGREVNTAADSGVEAASDTGAATGADPRAGAAGTPAAGTDEEAAADADAGPADTGAATGADPRAGAVDTPAAGTDEEAAADADAGPADTGAATGADPRAGAVDTPAAGTDEEAAADADAGAAVNAGAGAAENAAADPRAGAVDTPAAGTDEEAAADADAGPAVNAGAGPAESAGADTGADAEAGPGEGAAAEVGEEGDPGEDRAAEDGEDDGGEGDAARRPSVFDAPVPPPSLDPAAEFDEVDGEDPLEFPGEDAPVADAAQARRTMIGRSAEEVDHAPPRGRYAPVPVPPSGMADRTLRWAGPAAAALAVAAGAIAVTRALRRGGR